MLHFFEPCETGAAEEAVDCICILAMPQHKACCIWALLVREVRLLQRVVAPEATGFFLHPAGRLSQPSG